MSITIFLILILALAAGFAGGMLLARARSSKSSESSLQEIAALRARLESEQRRSAEILEHERCVLRNERELLREEMRNLSSDIAKRQSDELLRMNDSKIGELLSPLNKEIKDFRDTFVRNTTSVDEHIGRMMEKTVQLGAQTEQLKRALTAETKTQGIWGEGVLKLLLESSGLQEGTGFELQYSEKDEHGRNIFPDAVVHLPAGRNIVIDAKVSLTSFYSYANADTKEERSKYLKEHIASVKRHIDELSAKNYPKHTPGAMDYVFMFLPTEAGYVAAVSNDVQLSLYAYRKKVILLNPSTLLSVLQLADNLWNSENQSKSVNEVIDAAARLYDKFAVFANNYVRIGDSIKKLQETYEESENQLLRGRGNIVRQLESLKDKGVKPSKEVPLRLASRSSDDGLAGTQQEQPAR